MVKINYVLELELMLLKIAVAVQEYPIISM